MNNATPRNAVKIGNSRALSLLDQLILAARGEAVPARAGACPELAGAGEACAGNGDTLGAYLAPASTRWAMDPTSGEDFEVPVTYLRRCRY